MSASKASLYLTEKAKVIYVFGNGDKYEQKGIRVLIHSSKVKSMEQLHMEFSQQIGLPTGPVRRIIDQSNIVITNLSQFTDNGKYICCGPEKLMVDALPPGFAEGFEPSKTTPIKTATENTTPVKTTPVKTTPVKTTPVKTPNSLPSTPSSGDKVDRFTAHLEKGRNIKVFKIGEKYHEGVKLVIHTKKYKTMDQVKESLGRIVGTPVKKMYHYISAYKQLARTNTLRAPHFARTPPHHTRMIGLIDVH